MIKYIVLKIQNENGFQPSLCEHLGKTGFETEEQAKNALYESIANYLRNNNMTDYFSGYEGFLLSYNDNRGYYHEVQWRIIKIQI